MEDTSEVDSLLFGLTPDQWTEFNGIASSVTALAAVVGVFIALWAVAISRKGSQLAKKSVDIARRTSMEESFMSMMTAVRSYGAALYHWSEGAGMAGSRAAQRSHDDLNKIYVQLQAVEQEVGQFRLGGLPAWDQHIRGKQGVVTLAASTAALEYMIEDRFAQARDALARADGQESESAAERIDALLEEYVQGFYSKLLPGQRDDETLRAALRAAFRFQQDQVWADEMASGATVSRLEASRQAFDHVLNLVSDTWGAFAGTVAPWDEGVPVAPRAWT